MAAAKDKFVGALKSNRRLRAALNKAFDDLFEAAQIVGLSKLEKGECVGALRDYIKFNKDYDNVHIHWSS